MVANPKTLQSSLGCDYSMNLHLALHALVDLYWLHPGMLLDLLDFAGSFYLQKKYSCGKQMSLSRVSTPRQPILFAKLCWFLQTSFFGFPKMRWKNDGCKAVLVLNTLLAEFWYVLCSYFFSIVLLYCITVRCLLLLLLSSRILSCRWERLVGRSPSFAQKKQTTEE